jgi:ribosome biogenesis ATPase
MYLLLFRGRLDKLLYVPLPTPEDRVSILNALSGGINLSPDVNLRAIGRSDKAEGYSGADCAALLREAGLAVLKEDICRSKENSEDSTLCILPRHFDYAFRHVVPSVSRKDQALYNRMRDRMANARSRGAVVGETTTADGDADPTIVKLP